MRATSVAGSDIVDRPRRSVLSLGRNINVLHMNTPKEHLAFDIGVRVVSGFSFLGTIVILLVNSLVKREGPEFNTHELLSMLILITQWTLFFVFVVIGTILAGFRGGLRLSRLSAGLMILGTCALVMELFVLPS